MNGSQGSAWIKSSADVPKKLGVLMSFHISRFTPAPLFSCFPLCFALGRARAPCLFVIYVPRMIYTWQYRIAQCICSDVDAFAHTNALRTFSTCKHTSYIQHTHVFIFTHTYKKIRDPQKTTVLVFVNDKALSPGTTLKKDTIASKKKLLLYVIPVVQLATVEKCYIC